jgi:TPR repeat protein
MNSFYWTQSLLVIAGAVLAFFISFGPNRNRTKWLTSLGIAASVALFIANQVVMSNTGDGLDKQLNCWIWPAGVACLKQKALEKAAAPENSISTPQISAIDMYKLATVARDAKDYVKARKLYNQSCDNGDGFSCVSLGMMWQSGRGGLKSESAARYWYKRGCESGSTQGCDFLKTLTTW